jgi:group I intron endonuclease
MIELELMPNGQSGVYAIKHNVYGGKIYIGSSVSMRSRLLSHRSNLRRGKHPCRELQDAWNANCEQSFVYEIIEYVNDEAALSLHENHWINVMKSEHGGCFNLSSAGRHITSQETRP